MPLDDFIVCPVITLGSEFLLFFCSANYSECGKFNNSNFYRRGHFKRTGPLQNSGYSASARGAGGNSVYFQMMQLGDKQTFTKSFSYHSSPK